MSSPDNHTPNPVALAALVETLEDGNQPSRELDARILCALLAPAGAYVEQSRINGAWCIYGSPLSPGRRPQVWQAPFEFRDDLRGLTASLDTALALVEHARLDDRSPQDVLGDALGRMGRQGWDDDQPKIPQIARYVLIEWLTPHAEDPHA